jgi:hypothetical protein
MKTWNKPEIIDLKMTLTAGAVGFGGVKNSHSAHITPTPNHSGHVIPTGTPSITPNPSQITDITDAQYEP